jgi:predicted O-methyltransferase YrrM
MQKLSLFRKNNLLKLKIIIIIIFFFLYSFEKQKKTIFFQNEFDIYFEYHKYQREMITERMIKNASWQLKYNEPYFINGIIRRYKPKRCLEIGVAAGGSSIIILNAIKDIPNSFLISLDLNTLLYGNKNFKTGYKVFQDFPELTKKWKLYTGEQSHKFLDKLKLKFDFLLLDTAHFSPGELINIIEVLPFLEENAIIVLHDIMYHLPSNHYYIPKEKKFHPSNIFLMSVLNGDKIIIENKTKIENIGAIHLYPNQKNYYLNYFLLLLSPWEYMINEKHIEELRKFIKKYYQKEIYLNLFNKAVEENTLYINQFKKFFNSKTPLFNKYKLY